jgi:hypothetical protein
MLRFLLSFAAHSRYSSTPTRTQSWEPLGTAGASTQEEIQMMCIDNEFFIACNEDGNKSVSPFLEAFKVRDLKIFIDSMKWTNFIIGAPAEEQGGGSLCEIEYIVRHNCSSFFEVGNRALANVMA